MGGLNEAGCDPLFYGSRLEEQDAIAVSLGTSELCLFPFCFPLEPGLYFQSINSRARPLHYISVQSFFLVPQASAARCSGSACWGWSPPRGAAAGLGAGAAGCPVNSTRAALCGWGPGRNKAPRGSRSRLWAVGVAAQSPKVGRALFLGA